jgi:O-antigen/teichoic acid export membrane protein
MTPATPQATTASRTQLDRWLETGGFAGTVARYGISALGPISISGAHFFASLVFLHELQPAEFGLFSFLLIVVPFCMSMTGALLGASVTSSIAQWARVDGAEFSTHLKISLVLGALTCIGVGALMLFSGAPLAVAVLLGLFAGLMTLRWFARSFAYALHLPARAALSDVAYSLLLIGGLSALWFLRALNVETASLALLFSAAFALAMFGTDYLRRQFVPDAQGSLVAYGPIWRDLTRWSLLGVVLTELTANAHAYLVTFISGPKAFALLAVGSLVMRPVSLVLSALPDVERPRMAREIAAGRLSSAFRCVKEFRTAAGAIWLAAVGLAGIILMWFPHVLLKKGYDATDVAIAVGVWALIMALRALRTPESVLLQAAREFQPLAGASKRSSIISVVATLVLLLVAGPLASLGGIVAGEAAMLTNTLSLARRWKQAHV